MSFRSIVLTITAIGSLGALAIVVSAWQLPIPAIGSHAIDQADPATGRRGAELALLGDRAFCHTGRPPCAGGPAMPMPCGTIYSTNIAPLAETEIGRWPEEAFTRALWVSVDRHARHMAAVDFGQVVNPDAVHSQFEGGIRQAMGWALFEEVTFDRTHVTSVEWCAYPIVRSTGVPDSVDVQVVDRSGDVYAVAEAAQEPSAAAIAKAILYSAGARLHNLPFTAA